MNALPSTLRTAAALAIAAFFWAPSSLGAAQVPTEGDAVEVIEYTVQTGDTCAGIARRMWGDSRRYDVIHSYNPNMGPPPHRLTAGTVLRLPRIATSRTTLPDARVTAVQRDVTARPADVEQWRAATIGLDLYRGWHVATDQTSSAELTFRDTSVLALRADTLVIIFGGMSTRVRTGGTEAHLERGTLRTALGALRGDAGGAGLALHLDTPSARADMAGGSAVVSVDGAGTSRVSAHEGDVMLASATGAGRTRVPAGNGSAVTAGGRPSRPRPLPPAPTAANLPHTFVALPGRGADVSGSWADVPNAQVYRVEIATEADGRNVVMSTEVPSSVTRFELHGLPPGRYYLRLATIDRDFFESRPSAPIAIDVREAQLFAPGATEAMAAPSIDPSVEFAPLDVVLGTRVAMPEGVTCTRGESTSAELVLVDDAALHCTDASGAEVGLPATHVAPLTLGLDTPSVSAGVPTTLTLRAGNAVFPPGTVVTAEGGTIDRVEQPAADRLDVTVTPSSDASSVVLHVRTPDGATELASTTLAVSAAPVVGAVAETTTTSTSETTRPAETEDETPAPTEPGRVRRMTEAVGATPWASGVGLRDLDAPGYGGRLGIAAVDTGDGALARISLEAFASIFDDELRISVAMPFDPLSPGVTPWQRGSGDVVATLGWLALHRRPLSLLVDVAVWAPTSIDRSLAYARLVPSVELAYHVGDDATVRTRQAAIVDLAGTGARLWSSAYGFDARLAGPVGLGLEVDLTMGEELDLGFVYGAALVPAIVLDFDNVVVHLGGRFGAGRPNVLGAAGGFASVRVAAF